MKKIGIITAMQEEAGIIINKYQLKHTHSLGMVKKYSWIHKGNNIILVLAGIWKIQASLATSYLLLEHNDLDNIINIWIAWNISDHAQIWDVFMVTKCHQHDIHLPFDWEHLNYAKKPILLPKYKIDIESNFNLHLWVCATGDQFIDNIDTLKVIKTQYNADIVEMEAFAILSVAREFNAIDKCIVIKAVSDGANNEAIWDHMSNLDFAMNNSVEVLNKII